MAYSIYTKPGQNYEVTNHDNGKATTVSMQTVQARTETINKLKEELEFTKTEREKIYDDLYKDTQKKQYQEKEMKTDAIQAFVKISQAQQFLTNQPLYYDENKIWWAWNHQTKAWEMTDETNICNALRQEVVGIPIFETKTKTEILNALQMVARENKPKEPPKTWIQFKDKIVDIKTSLVTNATPTWFITNPIPHSLGNKTETPSFDRLFSEWVAPEYVDTLYEIMAYSLLPDYPIHSIFCLLGEGRNGKGTFLGLLTKLVGSENTCSSKLDTLLGNRFESSNLYKKLVCHIGEIGTNLLKQSDELRRLTGGDLIRIEFKQKNIFSAYNYAKIVLAVNELPETTEKTRGFYSRWLIVDFPNVFTKCVDVVSPIEEWEWENLCTKLCQKLSLIMKRGEFTMQGTYEERAARYEERASKFKDWLKSKCIVDAEASVPAWRAYEDYVVYVKRRNHRVPSKQEFNQILGFHGFYREKKNYEKVDGSMSTQWILFGLQLK